MKTKETETDAITAQLNRIERNTLLGAKNVLTVDDVALLAGLGKRTVYRLTSTHQIPFYKPNGKAIYFKRDEVESWLLQNRTSTNGEIMQRAVTDVVLGKKRVQTGGGRAK